jgi:hypothetical protein
MKTMNDDYLWDRSGEPDPDVQKLEEILGSLRYQPQPLRIPTHVQTVRRRSFFPALAIAAAIALCAVLLGLWFQFNRREQTLPLAARPGSQIQQPRASTPEVKTSRDAETVAAVKSPIKTREAARNLIASKRTTVTRQEIREPELTPQELAEKEQLLVALRLVSAKLNVAQRRTQGTPQLNPIRNQHKIG